VNYEEEEGNTLLICRLGQDTTNRQLRLRGCYDSEMERERKELSRTTMAIKPGREKEGEGRNNNNIFGLVGRVFASYRNGGGRNQEGEKGRAPMASVNLRVAEWTRGPVDITCQRGHVSKFSHVQPR